MMRSPVGSFRLLMSSAYTSTEISAIWPCCRTRSTSGWRALLVYRPAYWLEQARPTSHPYPIADLARR